MKFQTLVLYLFDVYCVCFNSNQAIFKVKTEKSKTEKIRGIQGLIINNPPIAKNIYLSNFFLMILVDGHHTMIRSPSVER